ncbi:sulfotransferase family protein [Myceligenerans xiligouense]|uniref:Sulfotransferase family protein n=1 Tax=Myceligenerans xiligouense TaxID=253184 RepID=A0A3N4Z264_9MICO|nr:sulfotransferase family protein [Myceligenerans xiligouense]RPF20118.1 hypothetical protein EDD34_0696 [Myceligenerans xiligouense]
MVKQRVFGIGFAKTGTSSLFRAMKVLGYSGLHHQTKKHPAEEIETAMRDAIAAGEPPLSRLRWLGDARMFFDIRTVERDFPAFDKAYPGSKFILHTRDLDGWLASCEAHVLRNRERGRSSWTTFDREGLTAVYAARHREVREYFAGRPDDLLEIDVPGGEGWEKLAPFLGHPVPDEPFPYVNVKGSGGRDPRFDPVPDTAPPA